MDISASTSRTNQMKPTLTERGDREERPGKVREAYLRDLEVANAKIQKIQEENDLLLDAMLANPPLSLNLHSSFNPKHYQSPMSPQPVVPSQGYVQTDRGVYQSAPAPPPPASAYQYPPRTEHSDLVPPAQAPQHGYSYSHQPPPRQYQYPPYAPSDGREGSGHHYSGSASGRSRGLPPDVGHRG
ncbi:hypothetical protein AN958_02874 [Leucoagaricus sp. SymC.cos]|nr:hypothetical protein AN958_02874 [Leucoagaricus sp. SymC.cos]